VGVGGEDQMGGQLLRSHLVVQQLARHEVGSHGLGGGARLRDHVHQGAGEIQMRKEAGDLVGIHVVHHEEPRTSTPLRRGQQVVVGVKQGRTERRRAER